MERSKSTLIEIYIYTTLPSQNARSRLHSHDTSPATFCHCSGSLTQVHKIHNSQPQLHYNIYLPCYCCSSCALALLSFHWGIYAHSAYKFNVILPVLICAHRCVAHLLIPSPVSGATRLCVKKKYKMPFIYIYTTEQHCRWDLAHRYWYSNRNRMN